MLKGLFLRQLRDVRIDNPPTSGYALKYDGSTGKFVAGPVDPADGSVTDAKLGNRTVNQAITDPFANTGTLTQILSWFAKQFHTIVGGTNWYDTPNATLANVVNMAPQVATPTSGLTLGTAEADVSGLSLTLANRGTYLVIVSLDVSANDSNGLLSFYLNHDGTNGDAIEARNIVSGSGTMRMPVCWSTLITTTGANKVIKIRGKCATGSGPSSVGSSGTYLVAIRVA
jgi:hypothetical protein